MYSRKEGKKEETKKERGGEKGKKGGTSILTYHHIQKLTQSGLELNIRAKTMKLLEENMRENLSDLGFCKFS